MQRYKNRYIKLVLILLPSFSIAAADTYPYDPNIPYNNTPPSNTPYVPNHQYNSGRPAVPPHVNQYQYQNQNLNSSPNQFNQIYSRSNTWVGAKEYDPIDERTNYYVTGMATTGEKIVFQCIQGKLNSFIEWHRYMGFSTHHLSIYRVDYKIDQGGRRETKLRANQDNGEITYIYGGSNWYSPSDLMAQFSEGKHRVVMRATPNYEESGEHDRNPHFTNSNPLFITLDLQGAKEALKPILDHCEWRRE
ncbi:hypothetical protein [Candidatus Nitrosacidococcus sp. I8]|uniref:hypothetical protein n=1 Tax=Candidatus Nitrosacidococcus sp. I8 TaxID=2942908 RepID=UPI002226AF94|nr:hypothetical protein [Candidatus Nitrosacidococcus sp. I8]CAH9018418.1 hypothetical protein NURINAE_00912 [Candidatus Nitrosacidococcus sp. I8]